MSADLIEIAPGALEDHLADLSATLEACVRDGASVGFVQPFGVAEASAFWTEAVFPGVEAGARLLWGALAGGRVVGTVQLVIDMMPNQAHRAEISKMLVHPDFRRRGLARALMSAAETRARTLNRTLLTLDTRSGDDAQHLYVALGFRVAGEVPGFAIAPDGAGFDPTTYMYKLLVA